MVGGDGEGGVVRVGVDVGDGAGYAENFVVGSGGEAEVVDALFEEFLARFVE